MVILLPDTGMRYLSKIYNDEWMRENQYFESDVKLRVADVLANWYGKRPEVFENRDLALAVFACHPRRPDAAGDVRSAAWAVEVVSRQCLGRHDRACRVGHRLEHGQELSRELTVPVADDPDLACRWVELAERVVPRRARYGEMMFVRQNSRFFISL